MIRSMTAYGSARMNVNEVQWLIELRSVNNRFLDLGLRLPDECRSLEPQLRELLSQKVRRGKLECRLSYERSSVLASHDEAHVVELIEHLRRLQTLMPEASPPRVTDLLRLQEHSPRPALELPSAELVRQLVESALQDFEAMRQREGARLVDLLVGLANQIDQQLDALSARLPELMAAQRQRLQGRVYELLETHLGNMQSLTSDTLDARILQEVGLLSLRTDVAEELGRLRSHTQELRKLLLDDNHRRDPQGKRLDFLCQEMNREANTLGSKAADRSVTEAAIDLKLFIEQIREQVQNLE